MWTVWAEERCPEYFPELNVEVLKREAGRPFAKPGERSVRNRKNRAS